MGIVFKYNDKIYQCANLEKKLKRLKIDAAYIQVLYEGNDCETFIRNLSFKGDEDEPWHHRVLYLYKHPDGSSIISIYNNLNIEGYELSEYKE
jgi:hypothetical protein